MAERIITCQPGFQTEFLSSSADIVIAGSGAGVGKTFALLLEPLRHITTVPRFGGVIFRRTTPQIRNEGGLWDASMNLYPLLGAAPKESVLQWGFKFGNKLKFSHMEHEKDKINYQGSEIPFIAFDELTHFTESQFFYLLTRNRSTCGIKPYVRATCNPDPDSWVADFISWWIDQETGYPIPERCGKLRYFIKKGDEYIWGSTREEVIEKASFILGDLEGDPKEYIKSVTFIPGKLSDNKELLKKDPAYKANLLSQDEQTRMQLLDGNWKRVDNDKDIFQARDFESCMDSPIDAKTGIKYITADIAMQGSDKFVVMVWDGLEVIDILIMDKSNGKEILDSIQGLQTKHSVPNTKVLYDNDGLGSFLGGFIPQGIAFKNNGKVKRKENYDMLKTQCFYKMGELVQLGRVKFSENVLNAKYDKQTTVRKRLLYERRSIKKAPKDSFGKLKIITKDEMKTMLNNQSPDLMDAFGMRAYFEYVTGSF